MISYIQQGSHLIHKNSKDLLVKNSFTIFTIVQLYQTVRFLLFTLQFPKDQLKDRLYGFTQHVKS